MRICEKKIYFKLIFVFIIHSHCVFIYVFITFNTLLIFILSVKIYFLDIFTFITDKYVTLGNIK